MMRGVTLLTERVMRRKREVYRRVLRVTEGYEYRGDMSVLRYL